MDLKNYITDKPNFPIPGVLFRDISPLLRDPMVFQFVIHEMSKKLDLSQIDYFAGIESRGFIFASALALHTKKGFLPLRKAGKLPPPTIQSSYKLEYGEATLEVHAGHGRIVIVDDVLATGGTLQGAIHLCEKAGFDVQDIVVLVDLLFLNNFNFKGQKVKSLVQY